MTVSTVLLLASACAPSTVGEAPPGAGGEDDIAPVGPLVTSLQVESGPDSVRLTLQVTNPMDEPVALTFATGQSFEFVVEQQGRELWRWSEDMMFTQAIRHERIGAGETQTFSANWSPAPGVRGEFRVRAWLTAQEHRQEQQMVFQHP